MEKVSKNFLKGDAIKSVEELIKLSEEKKSVYHHNIGIKPASVFMHMQLSFLIQLIKYNSLFLTVKIPK